LRTHALPLLVLLLPVAACSRVLGLEATHIAEHSREDGGSDAGADRDAASADAHVEMEAGQDDSDAGPGEHDGSVEGGEDEPDAGLSEGELEEEPSTLRTFRTLYPWPHFAIGVCLSYSAADATPERFAQIAFAKQLRVLIEATWGRRTGLTFLHFDTCRDGPFTAYELALEITDSAPSRTELGFAGLWQRRSVRINRFDHNAELLYTVGRALGFGHEYGRRWVGEEPCVVCDAHDDCDAGQRCMPSGYCGKTANHESIMGAPDRCGGVESVRHFSPWDIQGAQRAYGRKHQGALVTPRGYCAHLEGGLPTPGAAYVAWYCGDFEHDSFQRVQAAGSAQLRMFVQGQPVCLAAAATPSESSSSAVVAASCEPSDARQGVSFLGVELRGLGDMCLSAQTAASGTAVHNAPCDTPGVQQRWDLVDPAIRLAGSNLCLSVEGGQATLSAALKLTPCSGALNQRLRLLDGEVRFTDAASRTLCLNSAGGEPTPWAKVVLWDGCGWATENSRYFISGPVRIGAGCLGLSAEQAIGQGLSVEPCDTAAADQHWDFHF
jgi:hypothetical protein